MSIKNLLIYKDEHGKEKINPWVKFLCIIVVGIIFIRGIESVIPAGQWWGFVILLVFFIVAGLK